MNLLTQAEIDRFQSVAAVLTVRVDAALNELMETCRTEVSANTGAAFEESAQISAGVVMAILLKQLRTAGCPDEALKQLVGTAVILEQYVKLPGA